MQQWFKVASSDFLVNVFVNAALSFPRVTRDGECSCDALTKHTYMLTLYEHVSECFYGESDVPKGYSSLICMQQWFKVASSHFLFAILKYSVICQCMVFVNATTHTCIRVNATLSFPRVTKDGECSCDALTKHTC